MKMPMKDKLHKCGTIYMTKLYWEIILRKLYWEKYKGELYWGNDINLIGF